MTNEKKIMETMQIINTIRKNSVNEKVKNDIMSLTLSYAKGLEDGFNMKLNIKEA